MLSRKPACVYLFSIAQLLFIWTQTECVCVGLFGTEAVHNKVILGVRSGRKHVWCTAQRNTAVKQKKINMDKIWYLHYTVSKEISGNNNWSFKLALREYFTSVIIMAEKMSLLTFLTTWSYCNRKHCDIQDVTPLGYLIYVCVYIIQNIFFFKKMTTGFVVKPLESNIVTGPLL